ncbi:tRNA threonylcarbamoyladenosine dehydratase 2 [Trichomonascus vanleenenianus]|uniref:tRNA threonylcarbamoyladenosine dehydratase n=1 Tax=Trichomonascus vanleenenianus TaxID=2268995 RepID=UPI003ECA98FB
MVDRNTVGLVAAVAAVSSVATLGATVLYSKYTTAKQVASFKREASSAVAAQQLPVEYSQELIDEQLARNRAFLGDNGLGKIRDSFIIVVGAGGVGSWAATMLVRSGVKKIRIIDFDQVTLSSLNRHACATTADVGTPKVECIANFLRKVAPFVEIEPVIALWHKETSAELLEGNPTYIVDAIDNIDTKIDLLEYCYVNKLPVISAMGAGCKADPTRVQIADISMSIEDPLSRSVRRRLKLRGITSGIPVVFSTEKPGKDKAKLLDLDHSEFEKGQVEELSILQDFRVRILPVLGPLPAIFGLTVATHLINELGEYNPVFDILQGGYSLAGKSRSKLYESALQSLVGQAARMDWPESRKVPITTNDAGYIIEEVFRGKSPISGEGNRLVLSYWDPNMPLRIGNILPMTKDQQAYHETHIFKNKESLESAYSADVLKVVNERFKEDEWYQKMR